MEVKTSLLDNMIGVGDMVLLEPLNEETFINNLKKRFDHNEIYVSMHSQSCAGFNFVFCGRELAFPPPQTLLSFFPFPFLFFNVYQSPEVFSYTLRKSFVCSFGT